MGCGPTIARSAELGRGTATGRSTRARLGRADCTDSPARTAGSRTGCTGGTRNARVAQWLMHDGRDGQVGRHDHQPSNQVGLGRETGP